MDNHRILQVDIVSRHLDSVEPSSLPRLLSRKDGDHRTLPVELTTQEDVVHNGDHLCS